MRMKKITIAIMAIISMAVTSFTFANDSGSSKDAKTQITKTTDAIMMGKSVTKDTIVALSDIEKYIGKEITIAGVVSDVDSKGAFIKIGEKEKIPVYAIGFVFPVTAKGMNALVLGTVEKKDVVVINAVGVELNK
jgi:hypothetical protein